MPGKKVRALMVGVSRATKGGMWTVAKNYLDNKQFNDAIDLKYIPTSTAGNVVWRVSFVAFAIMRVFFYTLFHKYDILHVHMSERGSVFRKNIVIRISRMRNARVIIHMHGAEFEEWYKTLSDNKKNKVQKILNSADKIIILGEYWRDFIGSIVTDDKKIVTVYNAVDLPSDAKYNVKSDKMLFLGVVSERKGIFDLLKAMKEVDEEGLKAKLLIYGPDAFGGISEKIKQMRLQDKVEYMGWLKPECKKKVFSEVSVNILPSHNEGLPMTILETMSFGIPNITTDVAAIPEAVNKDNGILIKPGDVSALSVAIKKIMKSEKARETLGSNARQTIKNDFSMKVHIKKILSIYENLV